MCKIRPAHDLTSLKMNTFQRVFSIQKTHIHIPHIHAHYDATSSLTLVSEPLVFLFFLKGRMISKFATLG